MLRWPEIKPPFEETLRCRRFPTIRQALSLRRLLKARCRWQIRRVPPSTMRRTVTGLRASRMRGIRAVPGAGGDAVPRRRCPQHQPATRRSSSPHRPAIRPCRTVCRVLLLARVRGTDRRAGGVDDAAHQFANPRGNEKRSEERRVGKECRARGSAYHEKKKDIKNLEKAMDEY